MGRCCQAVGYAIPFEGIALERIVMILLESAGEDLAFVGYQWLLTDHRAEPSVLEVPTIWLILPVVICSFQRLSHACLSTCRLMVKPRMAHYNSYSLQDDAVDRITVVILELIHALISRPYGMDAVIRIKPSRLACHLVNLNNPVIARSLYRRHILQMSALSTVDGSLCAYHGCYG